MLPLTADATRHNFAATTCLQLSFAHFVARQRRCRGLRTNREMRAIIELLGTLLASSAIVTIALGIAVLGKSSCAQSITRTRPDQLPLLCE